MPGKWSRPGRTGEVGVDGVVAVAVHGHGFGDHSLVLIGPSHVAPFLVQGRGERYIATPGRGTRCYLRSLAIARGAEMATISADQANEAGR